MERMNGGQQLSQDVPVLSGVAGTIRGISLGDVDGDGHLDAIAALDYNTQPKLIMNDGTGVFTDETATRLPAFTVSATRGQFADIDKIEITQLDIIDRNDLTGNIQFTDQNVA